MSRARKRRRKAGDLTINDDHVVAMIRQMQQAAEVSPQAISLRGEALLASFPGFPLRISGAHIKQGTKQRLCINVLFSVVGSPAQSGGQSSYQEAETVTHCHSTPEEVSYV